MGCMCVIATDKPKSEISFNKNQKPNTKNKITFGEAQTNSKKSEENITSNVSMRKSKAPIEIKHDIKSIQTISSKTQEDMIKIKRKIFPSERNSLNTSNKAKSIRRTKSRNFKTSLFELINEARSYPLEFIDRIKEYKAYIKTENNKPFIEIKEKMLQRINLIKGEAAFDDLIATLHSILPLQPYVYKEELEIPIDKENVTKREKLTELLSKQSKDLADKFKSFSFHLDSDVKDPELSLILQLVDDSSFKGRRRSNLLSHNFNCIGITTTDISNDNKFYVYLVFAQK
jgi:hypothetical protein